MGLRRRAPAIRPFVEALGPIAFGSAGGLAGEVTGEIERQWETLRAVAAGDVTTPPLRILVKHYPRPALAGRCVTIHATLYNMLDVYLDRVPLASLRSDGVARVTPGVLLDLRRTYQLEGGAPRRHS